MAMRRSIAPHLPCNAEVTECTLNGRTRSEVDQGAPLGLPRIQPTAPPDPSVHRPHPPPPSHSRPGPRLGWWPSGTPAERCTSSSSAPPPA